MKAFYGVLLALAASAASMGYSQLLTDLSTDSLAFSDTEGLFVYSVPDVKKMVKRGGTTHIELNNVIAELPGLDMYSYDRATALKTISEAATEALQKGNYGDFFYLWEVMHHNGNTQQINDLSTGEFKHELEKQLGKVPRIGKILASSSTVAKIAELYNALENSSEHNLELQKRDTTVCSNSNIPKPEDCGRLMAFLENGLIHARSTLRCIGNCCAAWNRGVTFHATWARGKVGWCKDKCIDGGRSCKILDMNLNGVQMNFCVSSVAGACT